MTHFSWTVPLRPAGATAPVRLDREEVWRSMEHKAEDPSSYVPYIVGCEVLERYPDGMLREIAYSDRGTARERVWYEKSLMRMTFVTSDDPDITEIVNEVGEGKDGELTFTLRVTLTDEAERKAQSDPDFLPGLSRLFAVSLRTIVDATVGPSLTH
ncbi:MULTISPECIES: AtaL-like protein [unclassified Streptomyces]|uniref:AtaL-like protein n=1 Tax=unclassified Streptomyces TaxID=2593676 RepID=UPI0037913BD0